MTKEQFEQAKNMYEDWVCKMSELAWLQSIADSPQPIQVGNVYRLLDTDKELAYCIESHYRLRMDKAKEEFYEFIGQADPEGGGGEQ